MEVMEAIAARRSIRRYQPREVPEGLLRQVLEAGRLAPSASNLQTWKFKVVTDPGTRKALREAAHNQRFVEEAPVVIVACADLLALGDRAKRTLELLRARAVRPSAGMILWYLRKKGDSDGERGFLHAVINVTIAVENMVLAATSLGLGTCWVRAFEEERVAEILSLPPEYPPIFLLPLGYPAEDPGPRPRKSLEEILI
ncbi:MAG: nitroreductase family protein [Candidatus Geothermincolales bacterium]